MTVGEKRLVVQTWGGGWGAALAESVSKPFEQHAGVTVVHRPHVGLALPSSLTAALIGGGRPEVDVIWSNSVPALGAATRGWCVPIGPMSVLDELSVRALPSGDARRYVVHPYVVYYVLAYHEAAFADGPPTSWRALEDERHAGKIALYPGGNGFYPIAQVLGGGRVDRIPQRMDPCWQYLRRLRPQIGELDYSVGMEDRLRRRSLDLCFRALPNALAFRRAGVPVAWCVPREGTTDTLDALWIPRGTPRTVADIARAYIAFALCRAVQEDWCERLGAMPVHRQASPPSALRGRTDLPRSADDHRGILAVDEQLKVTHEPIWAARFDAIMTGV